MSNDRSAGTTRQKRATGLQAPPAGLSAWAQGWWEELLDGHAFASFEILLLEKALLAWDREAKWLAESEAATGREQARLVKQSLDAGQAALRAWKTLRFSDPARPPRRAGRPSGPHWSAVRKAAIEARFPNA